MTQLEEIHKKKLYYHILFYKMLLLNSTHVPDGN